ncbi:MAG: class II glutamine amidotransferase [Candidatus Aquirickettsiella gammari]
MCELLAMSGAVPEQLDLSLQILASHGDAQHGTNDGWGAAYYQGNDVALFREAQGAGSSQLLAFLQTHGPATNIAISHIRRATMGARCLANTQPFVRTLAGRAHTFAHNGNLAEIASKYCNPAWDCAFQMLGETDSERAFSYLLFLMQQVWLQAVPTMLQRVQVFRQFCTEMRELGPANFVYSDGEFLFVHAHKRIQREAGIIAPPGLWILERHCPMISAAPEIDPNMKRDVTLVASVPLTQEAWRPLEESEILVLYNGKPLLLPSFLAP